MKPPLLGLVDRKGFPGNVEVVSAFVVNVDWSELQVQQGVLIDKNPIDAAIAKIHGYTASTADAQAKGRGLKLKPGLMRNKKGAARVPKFVNDAAGLVPMEMNEGGVVTVAQVSKWWTAAYMDFYDDFIRLLAAKYDAVPEVAEVVIGAATTFYAESFLRQINPADVGHRNGQGLLGAGYTRFADQEAILRSIDAHKAFTTTHSVISCNPHQYYDASGSGIDLDFTLAAMDHAKSELGALCVLGNNDYHYDAQNTTNPNKGSQKFWDDLFARGEPFTMQTETAANLAQHGAPLSETLPGAVKQKVTAVELPGVYPYGLTDDELKSFDAQLRANWTPPAPPLSWPAGTVPGFTATRSGVTVSWPAASGPVDHYEVNGVHLSASQLSYTSQAPLTDTQASFVVAAVDAAGHSLALPMLHLAETDG